jgi:hypothetical protein
MNSRLGLEADTRSVVVLSIATCCEAAELLPLVLGQGW